MIKRSTQHTLAGLVFIAIMYPLLSQGTGLPELAIAALTGVGGLCVAFGLDYWRGRS